MWPPRTIRNILKTGQHLLYRFPIPRNRKEAELLRSGPRVLINTIPKAGTNLLGRVVSLMPSVVSRWRYHIDMNRVGARSQVRAIRLGQVATAHWKWESQAQQLLEQSDLRVFLMVRDPRDVVVSNAFYIAHKKPSHRFHHYFANQLDSDEERIQASIVGVSREELDGQQESKSMGDHIRAFMPWLEADACMLMRFEDLIGEAGGGSAERQKECIRQVGNHIGLSLDEAEVQRIADNTFSRDSRTFRKGKIGDWKNHFTNRHVEAVKEELGDIIVRLGYETDTDWSV